MEGAAPSAPGPDGVGEIAFGTVPPSISSRLSSAILSAAMRTEGPQGRRQDEAPRSSSVSALGSHATAESPTDLAGQYRDKRVFITGGLGFLGSTLAHRLVSYGAHVSLIDSLNPLYGRAGWPSRDRGR